MWFLGAIDPAHPRAIHIDIKAKGLREKQFVRPSKQRTCKTALFDEQNRNPRASDDGKTFAREKLATSKPIADATGKVWMTGDILETSAIVSLFTMVPFAVAGLLVLMLRGRQSTKD